jgi:hypothetical protein
MEQRLFYTNKKNSKRRLEAAEMVFLKPVAAVSLLDQERNVEIRKDLNNFKLTDKLDHYTNR